MADIATAKFAAIGTAFMMAGYGIMASSTSIPIIYDQPAAVSTSIFAQIFHRGTAVLAPSSVLSASASAYLAYNFAQQRRLWIASGVLVLSIGPFTKLFMMTGINRLLSLSAATAAEQLKAQKSGEVLALLQTWNAQNWVRVLFNAASGAVGLWAVINGGN